MSSRTAILKRIATAQHVASDRPTGAPSRCTPPVTKQPMHGSDMVDLFVRKTEGNGVIVQKCHHAAEIPASLTALVDITDSNPQQISIAPHAAFKDLDWQAAGVRDVRFGGWTPGDTVALSHARLGIADIGSIVLASGADSPTGLAFLPEIHVIALHTNALVTTLTDAMMRFREWETGDRNTLPRAINIISGASRTADIAGKLVHGAHGPRKLCVILYEVS